MCARLTQEHDAADDTARYALRFIQSIPKVDFTERVAMAIVACVQAKVALAAWSHTDHGIAADEYLSDVHLALENAADKMTQDAANDDAMSSHESQEAAS